MAEKPENDWHRVMVRFRPEHVRRIDEYLRTSFEYPPTRENFVRKVILTAVGVTDSADLPPMPETDGVRATG